MTTTTAPCANGHAGGPSHRDLSFYGWVMHHARVTADPEGDLIEDLRSDLRRREAPKWNMFVTLDDLKRFVRNRTSNEDALDAAPAVWRRYRQWHSKQ